MMTVIYFILQSTDFLLLIWLFWTL